jgi:hypothetical protein
MTIGWQHWSWAYHAQIQDVTPDWWGTISARCKWHDDEVYLQKRGHSIASGYSQRCMWNTLNLTLYHRQSLHGLQLRMTQWRSSPNVRIVSSFRSKQWSMQILFGLLTSPSPLQSRESTSRASCLGHQEVSDSYSSRSTHSPSGWRWCQWWISHKKQRSSSCRASYTCSMYPGGFWQIIGLSLKSKICKMLREFWYPPSAIISNTSSDERASRVSKQTYFTGDEDKNVPGPGSQRHELA